ncbi:hypothetical protein CTI14_61065, partial [Methylobacterium radiotolerans]
GLALAIHEGRTPPNLQDVRLVSLDLSGVVAGTKYRGEFEERLRQIIEELRNAKVIASSTSCTRSSRARARHSRGPHAAQPAGRPAGQPGPERRGGRHE